MRTLETIFILMLQASLTSAALIALALLVRRWTGVRLQPRLMSLVWLLVLAKLLIPAVPASPLNLYQLIPGLPQQAQVVRPASAHATGTPPPAAAQVAPAAGEAASAVAAAANAAQAATGVQAAAGAAAGVPARAPHTAAGLWLKAGSLVWLAGALALALAGVVAALRYRRHLQASVPADEPGLVSALAACRKRLGIRRPIAVYAHDAISGPCLYGLVKPAIYLPAGMTADPDERRLTHILCHELVHAKRGDLWLGALWGFAAAVNWFNPLVWLAIRRMKADRELACDAGVLEALGERESAAYGLTLLQLAARPAGKTAPGVSFSLYPKKSGELRRRIALIAGFRAGSRRLPFVAIAALVGAGAVLLAMASPPVLAPATAEERQTAGGGSLGIVRLMDHYKWFNSLERARAYVSFDFKVPDDIPAGYELESVEVRQGTSAKPGDAVTLSFHAGYGTDDVRRFTVKASARDLRAEYKRQPGAEMRTLAPATWGAAAPISYTQEPAAFAGIQGTLATQLQAYAWHLPERAKSFIWQEGDIWYALDYWSENHSREEGLPQHGRNLTDAQRDRLLRSFVLPEQLRQADYSGAGNSFPLYDEEDLAEAERILGFDVKLTRSLLDDRLQLNDALLLRPDDRNTAFYFRPPGDALESTYRAPYDAPIGDLNDYAMLYQSRTPLVDIAKLPSASRINMGSTEVTVVRDSLRSFDPYGRGTGQTDERSHTYYVWSGGGLHYMAFVRGLDDVQTDLVQAMIAAKRQLTGAGSALIQR